MVSWYLFFVFLLTPSASISSTGLVIPLSSLVLHTHMVVYGNFLHVMVTFEIVVYSKCSNEFVSFDCAHVYEKNTLLYYQTSGLGSSTCTCT